MSNTHTHSHFDSWQSSENKNVNENKCLRNSLLINQDWIKFYMFYFPQQKLTKSFHPHHHPPQRHHQEAGRHRPTFSTLLWAARVHWSFWLPWWWQCTTSTHSATWTGTHAAWVTSEPSTGAFTQFAIAIATSPHKTWLGVGHGGWGWGIEGKETKSSDSLMWFFWGERM